MPLAKAQRCLGLMIFTVVMWVSEAAPFEATAMSPGRFCSVSENLYLEETFVENINWNDVGPN